MVHSISGGLLVLGYTAIFIFLIYTLPFFGVNGVSRRTLSGIFLLKIGAGIAMWALYTYYYKDRAVADIFKFFDDSKVMYDALWKEPGDYFKMLFGYQNDNEYFNKNYYRVMMNWYREYESSVKNDAHTLIRFNAVVRLFSFGHYNVHTVFLCFLSLVGLTGIFKVFYSKVQSPLVVGAVFLIPSVLFWGSGVLKEGLLFFGLGIIVLNYFKVLEGKLKWHEILLTLFCLLLVFYLKFYVLAVMVISMIAYAWSRNGTGYTVLVKFAIVSAAIITLGLNLHHIIPGYNVLELLAVKQRDFIGMTTAVEAGSLIEVTKLEPNFWSFIKNAPEALYHSLCAPWLFTSAKPFIILAGLENLFVLLFAIAALVLFRRKWSDTDQPLVLFCLFFVIQLFLLIGWTTVVSGAIVRYKIPAIPFLFFMLILMLDMEKIKRRFSNIVPSDNKLQ